MNPEIEPQPTETEITEPSMTDNSEVIELLTSINEKLTHIDSYFDLIHDAVRVILSYGLIWVPLMILVTMLWWFFSQFLHKY